MGKEQEIEAAMHPEQPADTTYGAFYTAERKNPEGCYYIMFRPLGYMFSSFSLLSFFWAF